MDKVMKQLTQTCDVYEPMEYLLEKRIISSIVDDTWKRGGLIAFYTDSWAAKNINLNYWKQVNDEYLPDKVRGTSVVWFKYNSKYSVVRY